MSLIDRATVDDVTTHVVVVRIVSLTASISVALLTAAMCEVPAVDVVASLTPGVALAMVLPGGRARSPGAPLGLSPVVAAGLAAVLVTWRDGTSTGAVLDAGTPALMVGLAGEHLVRVLRQRPARVEDRPILRRASGSPFLIAAWTLGAAGGAVLALPVIGEPGRVAAWAATAYGLGLVANRLGAPSGRPRPISDRLVALIGPVLAVGRPAGTGTAVSVGDVRHWRAVLRALLSSTTHEGDEATATTSSGETLAMTIDPLPDGDLILSFALRSPAGSVDEEAARVMAGILMEDVRPAEVLHAGFCHSGSFHLWLLLASTPTPGRRGPVWTGAARATATGSCLRLGPVPEVIPETV